MLQHFLGQEIEVERPVFDDSTAILMDFRVDQTHGMHFILSPSIFPTMPLVNQLCSAQRLWKMNSISIL